MYVQGFEHKIAQCLFPGVCSRMFVNSVVDVGRLFESQREVAKVAEMIHTASLVHDDVLDASDTRRGKPSVNFLYGQRKVGTLSLQAVL